MTDQIDVCGHVLRSIGGTHLFCRRPSRHEGGHTDGEAWWTLAAPDAVAQEEWCRRCHGPNVAWSAPSPLWNYVMRGNDINGEAQHGDLVCMTCFVVLAAEAGLPGSGWRLTLHPEPDGLIYETPSGRIWDEAQFLWVEPEGQNAPVSTPSGPSAGLEGQDATQEPRDATEAALRAEVERLTDANAHLRERVGELESLRIEWRTTARQLAARAEAAEEFGRYDMDRATALAGEIRKAQAAALTEAADEIERATLDRLDTYGSDHAETARLAIEGCLSVLRRRAALDAPKDTTAP